MSMFISPPAYAKVPPRRQYSGASSAFSASANPDEDWTKVSDLTERRRIQNRIAQRNYRKKLKRRLEDLEHCAGSSDYAESGKQPQRIIKSKRSFSSSKPRKSQPATTAKPVDSQGPFTPPMEPTEVLFFPGIYDDRTRSRSPPQFACSTYPVPDEIVLALEGSAQPYPIMTTADDYPNYLLAPTFPMTLPSMTHFSDAVKWESYLAYNGLTPYTSYGYMPPMDFNAPGPYDQTNPNTPNSSDYSANCSEADYKYSIMPL
ncbi:hypothetical protein NW754_013577 [Fusarium falciforme]|uniref:BZIP domain-containing protein n=1 Tax=Fusarium falciforme TaxID=195108 RepID=A0A9W8QVQ5_9HYPO|nr:hypothetical protein NW754_013577 [Fusarium falciforme]KAJ4177904.1 hypothetical protein NW755_013593 [Fusarium falciforme]KAJ4185630.1 hypothetical protein NW767_012839 [Fusarium falciforme]